MKFVMSYSCGKDSTLALHHMIGQGHEPIALLTMVNETVDRSFFHGADYKMLQAYSEALRIPLLLTSAKGENYHLAMEESLRKASEMGAEAACFGDIDIEANRQWAEERCNNTGLEAFPLGGALYTWITKPSVPYLGWEFEAMLYLWIAGGVLAGYVIAWVIYGVMKPKDREK